VGKSVCWVFEDGRVEDDILSDYVVDVCDCIYSIYYLLGVNREVIVSYACNS
jgi:hypothetical protein